MMGHEEYPMTQDDFEQHVRHLHEDCEDVKTIEDASKCMIQWIRTFWGKDVAAIYYYYFCRDGLL